MTSILKALTDITRGTSDCITIRCRYREVPTGCRSVREIRFKLYSHLYKTSYGINAPDDPPMERITSQAAKRLLEEYNRGGLHDVRRVTITSVGGDAALANYHRNIYDEFLNALNKLEQPSILRRILARTWR